MLPNYFLIIIFLLSLFHQAMSCTVSWAEQGAPCRRTPCREVKRCPSAWVSLSTGRLSCFSAHLRRSSMLSLRMGRQGLRAGEEYSRRFAQTPGFSPRSSPSPVAPTDGVFPSPPGRGRRGMPCDRLIIPWSTGSCKIVFLVWDTVLALASETAAESFLSSAGGCSSKFK